jgi:hypothetical protein
MNLYYHYDVILETLTKRFFIKLSLKLMLFLSCIYYHI